MASPLFAGLFLEGRGESREKYFVSIFVQRRYLLMNEMNEWKLPQTMSHAQVSHLRTR